MSDKVPVQMELAENLAKLMHRFGTPNLSMEYVEAFFRAMAREWEGIDGLRLDKFYSLVRKFMYQSFLLLKKSKWDQELVQRCVQESVV